MTIYDGPRRTAPYHRNTESPMPFDPHAPGDSLRRHPVLPRPTWQALLAGPAIEGESRTVLCEQHPAVAEEVARPASIGFRGLAQSEAGRLGMPSASCAAQTYFMSTNLRQSRPFGRPPVSARSETN